ncbi:BON domain-containing protein [Streptomyces sp. NPDC006610]|jgi:hypothetical protein|uniref:BON domain-containing protein n=1 Tax=Streptomyces sp. NPDC006610 TaxID=3154584 RepID=UPI0033A7B2EC
MTDTGAGPVPGAQENQENADYRIARVRDRLAAGDLGELGVRVEVHGASVLVTGTVPTAECRDDVRRLVEEELAGFSVHCDIAVTSAASPDHAEELA